MPCCKLGYVARSGALGRATQADTRAVDRVRLMKHDLVSTALAENRRARGAHTVGGRPGPTVPADELQSIGPPAHPPRRRRMGGVPVFDYLGSTLPLAGTYRAIMGVFFANADTFAIAVPTETVLAQLA